MKKTLLLILPALMLMLAGCPQAQPNPPQGPLQNSQIEMYVNQITLISFDTLSAGDFYITVADPTLIQCTDSGVVTSGSKTGVTTITLTLKTDQRTRSTVTVTVREVVDDVDFSGFYTWKERDIPGYTIYRLRYYRAGSSDALLTRNDDYFGQDTATVLNHHFPEAGEWLHLFDATDRQGQNREVGLFLDSVAIFRLQCLSAKAYDIINFDSIGYGAELFTQMPVFIDGDSLYITGVKQFVDDPRAFDFYRKPGVAPQPMPGYIQTGHFNAENYATYFQKRLIDPEEFRPDDYPYYKEGDCELLMMECIPGGDNPLYWNFGHPVATGEPNLIELVATSKNATGTVSGTCANYNFNAELLDDWTTFGLKIETRVVDGRTGLYYVDPAELNPLINARITSSASLAASDPYLP